MLIRAFETALAKRRDHGFQLLSTGEEAVAVGLCSALAKRTASDGGRSIGPALARGIDPGKLAAELLGNQRHQSRQGRRGHLADLDAGFLEPMRWSAAISASPPRGAARNWRATAGLSSSSSVTARAARSAPRTLNMAAIWKLPLLFVCNNNQLSVSASRADVLAPKKLSDLGTSFGLPSQTIDGMDVETVAKAATAAAQTLREAAARSFWNAFPNASPRIPPRPGKHAAPLI